MSGIHDKEYLSLVFMIGIHFFMSLIFIIIIIIKRGRQCKARRKWSTPYESKDPNPIIPTYRQKEEKWKIVEDKKG